MAFAQSGMRMAFLYRKIEFINGRPNFDLLNSRSYKAVRVPGQPNEKTSGDQPIPESKDSINANVSQNPEAPSVEENVIPSQSLENKPEISAIEADGHLQ